VNELTLVIGGSASGKSEYAEELALGLAGSMGEAAHAYYIATMRSTDSECDVKIARHRSRREGTAFATLELPVGIGSCADMLEPPCVVLVECVSNLLANEMYGEGGCGMENADRAVVGAVERLLSRANVVVVSNEVSLGGTGYDECTLDYMRRLGRINCALAAIADRVVEVVSGIPVVWKP
jgi:adenosylcobinamide kinase/adenosylcobinamide-phosphate guanylyltransferase